MTYTKTSEHYIIRLFQGEEVISAVTKFCVEHNITSGFFCGLGAVKDITMGYYDLEQKEYQFTTLDDGIHELISITGNVAFADGETVIHAHGSIADRNLHLSGGHIKEMTVGVTVEIFLTPCDSRVERELDDTTGLKLMNFSSEE